MLGIFAKRKFDSRQRALKRQFARGFAPTQLDHNSLPADWICAAMKNIRRGNAAGKIAINIDVIGIQYVSDICHRRNRRPRFVHAAVDRDM